MCFRIAILLLAICISTPIAAQETIRTVTVSSPYAGTSGSSRAALSIETRSWMIVWTQPPSSLMARVVSEDGTPGATRVLAQNARRSPRGLDLAYDADSSLFLIAYESTQGLRLQWLHANLQPASPMIAVTQSVTTSNPRIVIHEKQALPVLYWIGDSQGRSSAGIHSGILDANRITSVREVQEAAAGVSFTSLSASEHPENKNHHLLFTETGATSRTLLLRLKADRYPVAAPVVLQAGATTDFEAGETVFASAGGLVVWNSPQSIRYRTLLPSGGFKEPSKAIPLTAGARSVRAEYEVRSNRVLAAWAGPDQIQGAILHPSSGTPSPQPFVIAEANAGAAAVEVSSNKFSGKSLVVWEEIAGENGSYRIQGALVSSTPEIFPIVGTVVRVKVYKPPVISHGYKYLLKYHVKSGKTYYAYVTPETEFEGRRPVLGDTVRMIFEPFRNRFRGYIEEIEVVEP